MHKKTQLAENNLEKLILQNLNLLIDLGFNVRSVISDQGSPNRSAYKIFGVTPEVPYIVHKSMKIYMLFDPCHPIKNVRNTIMKNDVITPDGRASWQVLKKLYSFEQNRTTRMCLKLTERHISPNDFEKQKVRYATQALSLTLLFQPQFLSKIWTKCLIALTEKFYTTTESHIDLRKNSEAYEYLRSITDYISKIETKVNVYCLDGLIQTINGVLALADDLFDTIFSNFKS